MSQTNITNENKSKTKIAWGLGTKTLDDWLENDLKQSSLFKHSNNSKCSLSNITIQENESLQKQPIQIKVEDPDIKIEQQKLYCESNNSHNNNNNSKSISDHLIPLIKVYSLLSAIKQNETILKENKHHHHSSNSKKIISPIAPPSPSMSIDTNKTSSCNNTNSTITNKKRKSSRRGSVTNDMKRQMNTDAARRSRLRKVNLMGTLEVKVDELKNNNDRLRVKVAVLESEVNNASDKEQRNRQRVLDLEVQLALAHKKLIEDYKNGE